MSISPSCENAGYDKSAKMNKTISCAICGIECERTGHTQLYCKSCAKEHERQRHREWHVLNPERSKEISRNVSLKNRERIYAQRKVRRAKLRLEVLSHYSNGLLQCACCGESHTDFLAVDHINGNGKKHRRDIRRSGTSFFRWLRQNNYPEGYRVLCHNCNQAIGYYGSCPHERE